MFPIVECNRSPASLYLDIWNGYDFMYIYSTIMVKLFDGIMRMNRLFLGLLGLSFGLNAYEAIDMPYMCKKEAASVYGKRYSDISVSKYSKSHDGYMVRGLSDRADTKSKRFVCVFDKEYYLQDIKASGSYAKDTKAHKIAKGVCKRATYNKWHSSNIDLSIKDAEKIGLGVYAFEISFAGRRAICKSSASGRVISYKIMNGS